MTFFTLTTRDYFGGRTLLLKDHKPREGDNNISPMTGSSRRNQDLEDFGTLAVVSLLISPDTIDCGQ